jgi:ATP-dependent RNA helicase DDX21
MVDAMPVQLANCGLSDGTVKTLEKRGILALFPIQKHVFEPAMAGRDLIGRARTGSGKTLAFALPVIESLIKVPSSVQLTEAVCSKSDNKCLAERLGSTVHVSVVVVALSRLGTLAYVQEDNDLGAAAKPRGRAPRCIILAPTRELAQQVQREFAEAAPSLAIGVFYGGACRLLLLDLGRHQHTQCTVCTSCCWTHQGRSLRSFQQVDYRPAWSHWSSAYCADFDYLQAPPLPTRSRS